MNRLVRAMCSPLLWLLDGLYFTLANAGRCAHCYSRRTSCIGRFGNRWLVSCTRCHEHSRLHGDQPEPLGGLAWYGRWAKAFFRLDMTAVCDLAKEGYDYHDYPDDVLGTPCHFTAMKCVRCGRPFTM